MIYLTLEEALSNIPDLVIMPDMDKIREGYDVVVKDGGIGLTAKQGADFSEFRPPHTHREETKESLDRGVRGWVESFHDIDDDLK